MSTMNCPRVPVTVATRSAACCVDREGFTPSVPAADVLCAVCGTMRPHLDSQRVGVAGTLISRVVVDHAEAMPGVVPKARVP